jgi:hypothetical protein
MLHNAENTTSTTICQRLRYSPELAVKQMQLDK